MSRCSVGLVFAMAWMDLVSMGEDRWSAVVGVEKMGRWKDRETFKDRS